MEDQKQVQVFSNDRFKVHIYRDVNDVIQFEAEDVARCLGIMDVHKAKNFATSGEKYETVRWARFNSYLKEFGFPHNVGKGDFIPENFVYRLAMKADNETAKKFQEWLANDVVPKIMHTGSYTLPEGVNPPFADVTRPNLKNLPPYLTDPIKRCVYVHAMSDNTVKIGKSKDFRRRAGEIKRKNNLEILDSYRIGYLPPRIADEIEKNCLRTFDLYRVRSEYFTVSFTDACTELRECTTTVIETHRTIYGKKWPDSNAEYDKYLSEIPPLPNTETIEVVPASSEHTLIVDNELSPQEKIDVLLKCAGLAKSDAFHDEILRIIISSLTGKKF